MMRICVCMVYIGCHWTPMNERMNERMRGNMCMQRIEYSAEYVYDQVCPGICFPMIPDRVGTARPIGQLHTKATSRAEQNNPQISHHCSAEWSRVEQSRSTESSRVMSRCMTLPPDYPAPAPAPTTHPHTHTHPQ